MKVVTLGEIMLRLSTPGYERFVQSTKFDVNYGGGEANVAVSLAQYGVESYFVSKVPEHEIGTAALDFIRKYGVDTKYIVRGGKRLGIYYLETGASMRASKVIYDRDCSSISEADVEEFDFDKILEGADWFHFTGITPAISKKARLVVQKALEACKRNNVTVSCDLNYRKKLWSKAEAQETMTSYMPYIDYVIGNEEDATACLGMEVEKSDIKSGKLDHDGYVKMMKNITDKFNVKGTITSLRESYSASDNGWSILLYTRGKSFLSKHYDIRIVDRVGGGDSFAAGFIFGLNHYKDEQKAVEFAAAASAMKQTIPGDFNLISFDEVEKLMNGDGSGRVQR